MSLFGIDICGRMGSVLFVDVKWNRLFMFFGLFAANDVWLQSGLRVQKWGRLIHSFFDLMELLQTRLSLDDALFFCCIAYFI